MRPLRSVLCLSIILLSAMALAQSVSVPSNRRTKVALPIGSSQLSIKHSRAVAHQKTPEQTSASIFAPAVTYGSGGYQPSSVAVADVNGDGKPDLLLANGWCNEFCTTNGTVGVLLGNGDGTFQTAVPYGSGGKQGMSLAVADVNGDGKLDVLVANGTASDNNGSVGVLLGNGDGTFQTVVTYPSGGYLAEFVAVADMNGDGKLDVLVANWCDNSACTTYGTVGAGGDFQL